MSDTMYIRAGGGCLGELGDCGREPEREQEGEEGVGVGEGDSYWMTRTLTMKRMMKTFANRSGANVNSVQ